MKNFLSHFSICRVGLILFLMELCLLPEAEAQNDEPIIPKGYPEERYKPLWKKSPFTLSSISSETMAGFAENLALTGFVKIGNVTYVSIVDKTTYKRELISNLPNNQGIQLFKLDSSSELEKVSVILQKGAEKAVLHYDMAFLKGGPAKSGEPDSQTEKPPVSSPENPSGKNSEAGPNSPNSEPPPAPNRPVQRRLVPSQPGAIPSFQSSPPTKQ